MLTAHPKVQDWLAEEISAVFGDEENPDYESSYPKLVCLAVMVSLPPFFPDSFPLRSRRAHFPRCIHSISLQHTGH